MRYGNEKEKQIDSFNYTDLGSVGDITGGRGERRLEWAG